MQIILFRQLCLLVTHSLTQYDGILLVYCSGFWVDPTKGYSRSYFQAISMLFDDADCFRKVPTFLPFHLSFQHIPANHYVISRNLLLCPFSSSFLTLWFCLFHQTPPIGNMFASPFCNVWLILLPASNILSVHLLYRSYRPCKGFRRPPKRKTSCSGKMSHYLIFVCYLI